eukprot:SAG25_NODE_1502_length_2884_cov_2.245601_3_plen_71_part_00
MPLDQVVADDAAQVTRLLRIGVDTETRNAQGQSAREVALDRSKALAAAAFDAFQSVRQPSMTAVSAAILT